MTQQCDSGQVFTTTTTAHFLHEGQTPTEEAALPVVDLGGSTRLA